MPNNKKYEVIIVGGSYAGLSAALALGRSLRKILIIDSGLPCNRQAPHSQNFLTQDGEKPEAIAEKAKVQVLNYDTVSFLNDLVTDAKKSESGFEITTETGRKFDSNKLIFATGLKDTMANIKGFAECWGNSVIPCPYCHGYEFRNQKTGIMANGEMAVRLAPLIRNLTDDVSLLTMGKPDLTSKQLSKLKRNNIQIVKTEITEIEHHNGQVNRVIFSDGSKREFKVVYAVIPFAQHAEIPVALGCEQTEMGHFKVDEFQETNIKGVFACGDNSTMMRSVANSVASGNLAGAAVNKQLAEEEF